MHASFLVERIIHLLEGRPMTTTGDPRIHNSVQMKGTEPPTPMQCLSIKTACVATVIQIAEHRNENDVVLANNEPLVS